MTFQNIALPRRAAAFHQSAFDVRERAVQRLVFCSAAPNASSVSAKKIYIYFCVLCLKYKKKLGYHQIRLAHAHSFSFPGFYVFGFGLKVNKKPSA